MSRIVTIPCPECEGEVEMRVYAEPYGADADGNRGTWVDEAEVYSAPCGCEWTGEQEVAASKAAVDASYEDEASYHEEPEEAVL